jgi:putative ABC transport system ATP-binding protein
VVDPGPLFELEGVVVRTDDHPAEPARRRRRRAPGGGAEPGGGGGEGGAGGGGGEGRHRRRGGDRSTGAPDGGDGGRAEGGDGGAPGRERLRVDRLCLREGGITVLSGPSGAGKSTLLRLCNRLDVPDEGVVRFRGTDLAELDVRALRRRVGMVFQRPTLFPGTVADNLRVARPDATREELVAALRGADLAESFLDRTGDDLSGGEAQRACLARTLLTEPEVLLLDEPTSSLDPEATAHLERSVRDLVAGGLSALWVSHDPAQAHRLVDRRVVLAAGRVVDVEDRPTIDPGVHLHVPDHDHDHEHEGADGAPAGTAAGQVHDHEPDGADGAPAGTAVGQVHGAADGHAPAPGDALDAGDGPRREGEVPDG